MNARVAPSILIVEDERIIARDLQQTLNDMGYDAFAIAASAEEAVACASRKHPDVVLMDIRIKGQDDGISTAAILKKKFPLAVIYLTAHADEAMLDRAKRTEPHGYLLKPVKSAELRSMIEITVHRRELDQVRDKLRDSERRLFTITDNVPVSIGYFDKHGRVQFANRVFREMVQFREKELGVSANAFLGHAFYKDSYDPRQRALAGEQVSFVVNLRQNEGQRKYEVTLLPDRDSSGQILGVYALGYDVTLREQLSAELLQARLDLETILNNIPAAVTSWRADLKNRFANKAAEAQFGIAAGASPGMHLKQALGEARYAAAESCIAAALGGRGCALEQTHEQHDGGVRYSHDEYIPEMKDGAVVGLYALSMDITEIRRSRDQVRNLAQRLETIREEERRKIAIILHDGIAQDLFAMKLGLDHIHALAKRHTGIQEICAELDQAIAKCMDDTRMLANELHPVALTYFNLGLVLREHVRRFESRSNLRITVSEADEIPALDEKIQLLFFRAAQEALTNVARHAGAQTVDIVLSSGDGRVIMEIRDDGVGITEAAMRKPHSLGLLGLRERVAALGGSFEMRRGEPSGTSLIIALPV
jgi:PAS domain S-box-containing protein